MISTNPFKFPIIVNFIIKFHTKNSHMINKIAQYTHKETLYEKN